MQELEEESRSAGFAHLPNPSMYPLELEGLEEGPDNVKTGMPMFPIVMRVDLQGKFGKEKSVTAFQNVFGSLPPTAMLEVTQMLFKSSVHRKKRQLPKVLLLALLSEH